MTAPRAAPGPVRGSPCCMPAARSRTVRPSCTKALIGTEFIGRVRGTATVGGEPAILPSLTGSAWITAFHQYVLDPSDPFPTGFRLGDTWPVS